MLALLGFGIKLVLAHHYSFTTTGQNASLNAALYVDRSRRKATPSYLFTGRGADEYDLETIYSIGVNSFLHLASIFPPLETYEDALFSERAKNTDRTLLSPDAIAELDKALEEFLVLLGPYLMEAPTGRVLEFLVKRFRIQEFNINAVMALFLPYHETPHFTKMLSIMDLKPGSLWGFLIPYKSAAQNIRRVSLVSEMLKSVDLARFITLLLPVAIKEGRAHRTLIAFNAATLNEFIKRNKALEEGTVAFLLPALLEPLQHKSDDPSKDAILGSYILLSALSQKCELAASALNAIIRAMVSLAKHIPIQQFVSAVLAVCEPQSELEEFTEATANELLKLPGLNAELTSACKWYGIEKVLVPLIASAISRTSEVSVSEFIENLIASPGVPDAVLARLTSSLIHSASADPSSFASRRLLASLQQRHPSTVQKVAREIIEEDEDSKEPVEQLILSLSVAQSFPTPDIAPYSDVIVASAHADAHVREIAVKKLVATLAGPDLPSDEVSSIQQALLARLFDSNLDVLEALYGNGVALSLGLLSVHSQYTETLAKAIASPGAKPKRAVLRLHIAFLTNYILPQLDAALTDAVFERIYMPFLLFSKPRQHTAELIWDFIADKEKIASFDLLKGTASLWAKAKASERTPENMATLNVAITSRIAENVMRSNDFSNHLTAFAGKLSDENPWKRSLAFLTLHSLLVQLSGSHQLQAGKVVLDALALDTLPALDDISEDQSLDQVLSPEAVGKLVVAKPNSKTTLSWLQLSLLKAVAKIPKPTSRSIDWFRPISDASTDPYDCYAGSVRRLYVLVARALGSSPVMSMGVLQVIFGTLGDDALVFLSGIWTAQVAGPLQTLSLIHASAVLEAHAQEQDETDFQTILPMLLIALQNADAQSRAACLECITRLRIIADGELKQVYKFDVVYGPQDQDLQYLDADDLKRYLDALLDHKDHFQGDPGYLGLFHGQYLIKNSGDRKRDTEYRKRVLSCLLSHVNTVSSPAIQSALLGSVRLVSDRSKLQLLLPAIQSLLSTALVQSKDLSSALLFSFNVTAVKDLNDNSKPFWKVFVDLLKKYLPLGANDTIANALVEGLRNGLSEKLDQNRKIEFCSALLDICDEHVEAHAICKELMSSVLKDVPVTVALLGALAPKVKSSDRAPKRAKTTESGEPSINKLTFFAEALNTVGLPGSVDLISHLLQALSSVVQTFSSLQADVNYTEQLLMSAIDTVASKVTELPNIAPSAIRLDVLVELIRVTDNPQTFHQALILMSNLTRLAPDSVLHNIMPVFTFMGSNVFHRDDASSFNVVQKTIDGIVPVMVSSLKRSASNAMDLAASAKDFLHIFTDAANHIPRHRRTKFFSHLVSALGAQDFLAPVCMLLVEKQANKTVRQSEEESKASLSLPVALLTGSPFPDRIQALVTVLDEVDRLRAKAIQPDSQSLTFLAASGDNDPAAALLAHRRRAQALLILVGLSFDSPLSNVQDVALDAIVGKLMALSTCPQESEEKLRDLSMAAQRALNQLLSVMPAMSFLGAIATILESEDSTVQATSLDLLSQRISAVAKSTRQAEGPTIIRIYGRLKLLVAREWDGGVPAGALKALQSMATTMDQQEHGAAAETVPLALKATANTKIAEDAWQALLPLSRNLGPRIIPHFRAIVQASLVALRSESTYAQVVQSTLQGLLTSIPTFWASGEVASLFTLYIDQSIGPKPVSSLSLIKAITKRVPSKILIPTLLEMWPPVQNPLNLDHMAAFFDLVFRALHGADRSSVLEQLRPLFKMFIEGLGFASPEHGVETSIISAFRELVVKLNETAFRPLFRRLYDWAFAAEKDDATRKVVFIHLYLGLQDYFKGLMSPYMSFLLQPFEEILKSFSGSGEQNHKLWNATIRSLLNSLNHDDSGFWRNDKLRQIATTLTAQIAPAAMLELTPSGKDLLTDCLISLVEAAHDDTLVKTINLSILMHTRSEEARVRLYALSCAEAIWRASGVKLLGFVAEATTFIAECSEDENDMVVRESLKLKHAVESVAGKIDEL
ncbi:hypothetical protein BKA70DRAFT_1373519 [Coprinopsis sp. MPI-PUGE-AT-0042]|nr:hypothetical protein BKA70DRAFT_1373519 [Coprinopsis sp. MPI-PUGE-AT-0042]